MAKNVSELMDSDYGISTTGIAEHWDDRTEQAFIAFYDREKNIYKYQHIVFHQKVDDIRTYVRNDVSDDILELLLTELKN